MFIEDDLVNALVNIYNFMDGMARQGDEWAAEFFGEGDWARCVPAHIREALNLRPDVDD